MDVEISVYFCCRGKIFSSPFVFYREGKEREVEGESVWLIIDNLNLT